MAKTATIEERRSKLQAQLDELNALEAPPPAPEPPAPAAPPPPAPLNNVPGPKGFTQAVPPSGPAPYVSPATRPLAIDNDKRCSACPGWKVFHPQVPFFGQCLPMTRWTPTPTFTTDIMGCSLPYEMKAKGANR